MSWQSLKARTDTFIDWRVLVFIARFFGLVSLWLILYHVVMQPTRLPDRWLTRGIAEIATPLINTVLQPAPALGEVVMASDGVAYLTQSGKRVFGIADLCNGLELMAIYAGLIMLLPGRARRKWKYVLVGFLCIFLANVVRAVALYHIYYKYYDYFLFNHKYVFAILMYVLVFIGWLLYTRKIKPAHA